MTKNKIYGYIKILSLFGIALAIYLLWEQYSKSPTNLCTVSSTVNCDAVISGETSRVLGIPTPLYGLVGYVLIMLAAMYHKKLLMLATATFGVGFCLWIAYLEFLLGVLCPICLTCQIVMILILILSIIVYRKK